MSLTVKKVILQNSIECQTTKHNQTKSLNFQSKDSCAGTISANRFKHLSQISHQRNKEDQLSSNLPFLFNSIAGMDDRLIPRTTFKLNQKKDPYHCFKTFFNVINVNSQSRSLSRNHMQPNKDNLLSPFNNDLLRQYIQYKQIKSTKSSNAHYKGLREGRTPLREISKTNASAYTYRYKAYSKSVL